MAEKPVFQLSVGKRLADELIEKLAPFSERVEIAGSIRREAKTIGDIEIVCIPKPYSIGLFADGIATVINPYEKVKGELEYGVCKYTQRLIQLSNGESIKLDLFFARPENWGLQMVIRTGSADFSKMIAHRWAARGYESINGMLTYQGKEYEMREEIDVFKRVGLEWIEPRERNIKERLII